MDQLAILVQGNSEVYNFDMLGTFDLKEHIRKIVHNKVVCVDSPVSVRQIMFFLKNWYWDLDVTVLRGTSTLWLWFRDKIQHFFSYRMA